MKDFDALKNIWHGQAVAPRVSFEEILSGVRKSKNSFANKLLIETLGMLAAIFAFALIWMNSSEMMWTTHLAFLVFVLCCLYYLIVQFGDYRSISKSEHLLKEPGEYIKYLKGYRLKRFRLNTTNYRIYSFFIGVAFALYFVEIYFTSPLWQTFAGIAMIAIWFFVCWYLMRVYMQREQDKLSTMISKLEELESQLAETNPGDN